MDIKNLTIGAPWSYVEDPNASDSLKRSGHVYQIIDRYGDLCRDFHPAPSTIHFQESAAAQITERLNMQAAELLMTRGTRAAS